MYFQFLKKKLLNHSHFNDFVCHFKQGMCAILNRVCSNSCIIMSKVMQLWFEQIIIKCVGEFLPFKIYDQ